MSKILYPKPKAPKAKRATPTREILSNRPYHVEYVDPNHELDPEWRYYNSELAVKLGAWFRCRVLGFHSAATLYDRDEVHPQ